MAAMPTTVALCACTTMPPPMNCPKPPEMLMRPPQALRSLPSLQTAIRTVIHLLFTANVNISP